MNSISNLLAFVLLGLAAEAMEIPVAKAEVRPFGKSVEVNAQIVQLSNARQSVMSHLGGHIEEYYVQVGEQVEKGQRIARIDSITLSQMTAEYLSLKTQFEGMERNYKASEALHEKGMLSLRELNLQSIERNAMLAKIQALDSQLKTLGIETRNLQKATSSYTLYAHGDGKVAAILQPLHSVIGKDTAIVGIVKSRALFLQSYLPLRYAALAKKGQRVVFRRQNGDTVESRVARILPEVDETTQRLVLLSSIDAEADNLYMNEHVGATVYFDADNTRVAIRKSALSFYRNEWVVFVPKGEGVQSEEGHGGHDDHGMLDSLGEHEEHQGELSSVQERDHLGGAEYPEHAGREEHRAHDEHDHGGHEGHDDHAGHEEAEVPYGVRVVEIIAQDDRYAAVKGLEAGDAYVSDRSYYVKSMLLKSSFGGHGH